MSQLSLAASHSVSRSRLSPRPLLALGPSPLFVQSALSSVRFSPLHHCFLVPLSPAADLIESVFYFFILKLTRQKCVCSRWVAEPSNWWKTWQPMPRHTYMHTGIDAFISTLLADLLTLKQFPQQHGVAKNNVFCCGWVWLASRGSVPTSDSLSCNIIVSDEEAHQKLLLLGTGFAIRFKWEQLCLSSDVTEDEKYRLAG